MNLLIFQTDIKSKKKVNYLHPVFNEHDDILKWTVDLEDIDKVLRIEATARLTENDIIHLVQPHGFYIESLHD